MGGKENENKSRIAQISSEHPGTGAWRRPPMHYLPSRKKERPHLYSVGNDVMRLSPAPFEIERKQFHDRCNGQALVY